MRIIQPVKTDSRIPAFLQTNTKQNIIFQITLVVVYIAAVELKDRYEERKFAKHYADTPIVLND